MKDEIVGTRVGIFDVLSVYDKKDKDGHKLYCVKCAECGKEFIKRKFDIKVVKVCNHLNNSWEHKNKRLECIYNKMIKRCYDAEDKSYGVYGEKGIKVCKEWFENPNVFEEWAYNNGYRDDLTIDRIDSSKDYCPENCHWVSKEYNARFKETTKTIKIEIECSGRQWAKICGVGKNRINRMRREQGLEETIKFIKKRLETVDGE